jgi:hypothetical protein
MPRLLRIHFASVGHRDARLSPLTLDFRGVHEEVDTSGCDSILWLRNGGGKSSIINLFYSLFRTSRREFLGSSAEGKARRLEDYVGAGDLAYVLTEWDLQPPLRSADSQRAPHDVRVIGQVMAWRNQQRSSDPANLRRVFFMWKCCPGYSLDDMPVLGLGQPLDSLESFRQWLRQQATLTPGRDLIETEQHRSWQRHLEDVGVDTELFRYQLHMNRREGAADEALRFTHAQEFINYLLELAFEPERAEQVARNLDAQRERLSRRPAYEREREFVGQALQALAILVQAGREEHDALAKQQAAWIDMSAFHRAIASRGDEQKTVMASAKVRIDEAREAARVAANLRDANRRWSRGLERRALELEVRDAGLDYLHAHAFCDERRLEMREAKAAVDLAQVRGDEARVEMWREELARSEKALEPSRRELVDLGTQLRMAIGDAIEVTSEEALRHAQRVQHLRGDLQSLDRMVGESTAKTGALAQELVELEKHLDARDRARDRLHTRERLELREDAHDARKRWQDSGQRVQLHLLAAQERQRAVVHALHDAHELKHRASAELGELTSRLKNLEQASIRAHAWQERLMGESILQEVCEAQEPSLETPGLLQLLRDRGFAARQCVLQSRVDSAQDERALSALERQGILPPPRDVQAILERLREAKFNAHFGLSYLEENAPLDQRSARISADPSLHTGIVIVDEDLTRVATLVGESSRSQIAIRIAKVPDLSEKITSHDDIVVLPDAAHFDRQVAMQRRNELENSRDRRVQHENRWIAQEREIGRVGADLSHYLEEHGEGKLSALAAKVTQARSDRSLVEHQLNELSQKVASLSRERDELEMSVRQVSESIRQAEQAELEVGNFIETFEIHVESWRSRKVKAQFERQALEDELVAARAKALQLASMVDEARDWQKEVEARRQFLESERHAVIYFDSNRESELESIELVRARHLYEGRRRAYDKEVSENRAKWELDQAQIALQNALARYEKSKAGLDASKIARWLLDGELTEVVSRLEQELDAAIRSEGEARGRENSAKRRLEESKIRREADDLPPQENFDSVRAARLRAESCREQAEAHAQTNRQEETRVQQEMEKVRDLERELAALHRFAQRIETQLSAADVAPLDVQPLAMPLTIADSERVVGEIVQIFARACKVVLEAQSQVRAAAQAVRDVANHSRFQDVQTHYKERLKAPESELREHAAVYHPRLHERLEVIERELEAYERDRLVLVQEMLNLGDEAERLLRRATRASILPAELGAWGGLNYLKIRYEFPESDDEKKARLLPLVDRVVMEGSATDGMHLVRQAVRELAGTKGFDVRILKPDTVLRTDAVDIATMVTFSRGQQLTAAILLYCTLVQLRAQTRGRGRKTQDAGVLILDNPIGTCSSVPLLKLQRSIAAQMKVQLIYATGVEDLEALAVMPNTIRLRNTHRDQKTGDHHVTHDPALSDEARLHEAQSGRVVEAVRIQAKSRASVSES